MIQYKIAAGLLGLGIVLWGLTIVVLQGHRGRASSATSSTSATDARDAPVAVWCPNKFLTWRRCTRWARPSSRPTPTSTAVDAAVARLRRMPPLVFAGECDALKEQARCGRPR